MKYIKYFENKDEYFWYIKGDEDQIINILKHSIGIIPDTEKHINNIKGYRLGLSGAYITTYQSWWSVSEDYEMQDYINGKKHFKSCGYKYLGEIELVDGKIEIDTFDVDVEKYNL